jgi:hypothetical protein
MDAVTGDSWIGRQSPLVKFALGMLMALALWLVWATYGIRFIIWFWTDSWSPVKGSELQALGQVGDLFGGINALFAAFAFVGVAIAAYYQYRTFRLQSEQHTRQSFEPLFFKLLDAQSPPEKLDARSVIDGREGDKHPHVIDLDQCMQHYRRSLTVKAKEYRTEDPKAALRWDVFRPQYTAFYVHNDGTLAPYFRKLFHVFRFIAESDLRMDEKVRYANIARASLNKNELLLLLLNGAAREGGDFKPLIEGLGLLKHVATRHIVETDSIDQQLVRGFFRATASMGSAEREAYWSENPSERPLWLRPK